MRWRRGLLRLWIVTSVIWLLITGAAFGVPQSLMNVISWHEPLLPTLPPGFTYDLTPEEREHATAVACRMVDRTRV